MPRFDLFAVGADLATPDDEADDAQARTDLPAACADVAPFPGQGGRVGALTTPWWPR